MSRAHPSIELAILARHAVQIRLPLRMLRTLPGHLTPPAGPPRFALIPGDAGDPAGSLGDLAMFAGLMHALRQKYADTEFTIIGTDNHHVAVPGAGDVAVKAAWRGTAGTRAFDRLIRTHQGLFVMGADILDGQYGAAQVARIAAYCNHSVKLGIPATLLGFSYNSHPRWSSRRALSRLHRDVTVNVRDAASLDRFTRLVGTSARLCADCAFLMPPAAETADAGTETWLARQRAAGRIPIGINLNAHAFASVLAHAGLDDLISGIADRLVHSAQRHALALLLIPHDLKPESGDLVMLEALAHRLHAAGWAHTRMLDTRHPDEIKRIAGQLDLVLTGRMHLAIAALGSGTPVLSITYQDKFEGLYQHFELSVEHTLQAEECLGDGFCAKLDAALAQRHVNRARIAARLPQVQALAERNLVLRPVRHAANDDTP